MRTIIDLPEEERQQLDALCQQRQISRAEGLRQALKAWLAGQQPSHGRVFGLWSDRDDDALVLEDRLRQEWADR